MFNFPNCICCRSQKSALNSLLTVKSSILTVDKGPAKTKSVANTMSASEIILIGNTGKKEHIFSGAFEIVPSESSVVYNSPGIFAYLFTLVGNEFLFTYIQMWPRCIIFFLNDDHFLRLRRMLVHQESDILFRG